MSSALKAGSLNAFGRKLLNNQKAFVLNNIMRMQQLIRYGTPGFRTVFQIVPYLLQVNERQTPGYVRGGDKVRGVFGFERSGFARILRDSHPGKNIRDLLVVRPRIQSLMLIGSIGSVGHTTASDLDYWAFVDRSHLAPEDIDILETKFRRICTWAGKMHRTEVHFFLMDLGDIVANRLGNLDEDNSGNVMPRLLKEEFYRTLLHVAGRMPLWWAVPPGTDKLGYERIIVDLDRIHLTTFDPMDYIDLGYVERPGPLEYLGAAMWQAHKSQQDLFKAVLKMILILEQVECNLQAPLLCDQVKEAVLLSPPDRLPVDPYLLTIRRVLDFSEKRLPDVLDLIRISSLFKIQAPWDSRQQDPADAKSATLNNFFRKWGWSSTKVQDLYDYPRWGESRKLGLSQEIKDMLLDLYSRIASKLRAEYPAQVKVEDESLTRLNARILARWADHEVKVEDLPSTVHQRNLASGLTIVRERGQWRVRDSLDGVGDPIYSASRAARVAAWLVHNNIWHPKFRLHLRSGMRPLKLRALLALLPVLSRAFPPFKISALKDHSLLPRPQGPRVLVINMEEPSDEKRIISAETIYRTNLGEMCHEVLNLPLRGTEAEKCVFLARSLLSAADLTLDDLKLVIPPGQAQDELSQKIKASLVRYTDMSETHPGRLRPRSKLRLDTD